MTTTEQIRDDFRDYCEQIKAAYKPGPRIVYVYALLDADDNLLYVGQSSNVERRVAQHRARQPWAAEIARHVVVDGPMERADAQVTERLMINEVQPIYNVYCTGRELPPRGRHATRMQTTGRRRST